MMSLLISVISPPLHGRELQTHNMQLDAHRSGTLANLIAVRNTRDKREEASRRMWASGLGIEKAIERHGYQINLMSLLLLLPLLLSLSLLGLSLLLLMFLCIVVVVVITDIVLANL